MIYKENTIYNVYFICTVNILKFQTLSYCTFLAIYLFVYLFICRSITRSYYRNSVGVLIVFDITKRASFESITGWLSEAKFHIEPHQAVYMIIGHKSDCESERQVSSREGSQLAKVNGLKYMETSAKNGQNVEDCFLTIAKDIYHLLEEGKVKIEPGWDGIKPGFSRNDDNVQLAEAETESKGCCS